MTNWKPIRGYEGFYEVSDHGDVRSLDRIDSLGRLRIGRVLKSSPDRDKYRLVSLSIGGAAEKKKVHRLVLSAFGRDGDIGEHCCHSDGDPSNNNIDNLRWASAKENFADGVKHGSFARNWNGAMQTSKADWDRVQDLTRQGFGKNRIAAWIGFSARTVLNLRRRGAAWWGATSPAGLNAS